MAEGSATPEIATACSIGTSIRKRHPKRRHDELIEIVEALLLAVVAVATAWSGYQASVWDRYRADKYVRNMVLLATLLFLVALAQRFRFKAVRVGLLGVSGVLLVIGVYFVLTYPVA